MLAVRFYQRSCVLIFVLLLASLRPSIYRHQWIIYSQSTVKTAFMGAGGMNSILSWLKFHTNFFLSLMLLFGSMRYEVKIRKCIDILPSQFVPQSPFLTSVITVLSEVHLFGPGTVGWGALLHSTLAHARAQARVGNVDVTYNRCKISS